MENEELEQIDQNKVSVTVTIDGPVYLLESAEEAVEGALSREFNVDSEGNYAPKFNIDVHSRCLRRNEPEKSKVEEFIQENPHTKTGYQIKMNGAHRFISKAGFILHKAFGCSDIRMRKKLLEKHPGLDQITKICRNHTKEDMCRAVCGAFLIGATPTEIEEEMKELDIWKD